MKFNTKRILQTISLFNLKKMTAEKTEKTIEIGYSDFIRLCRVNDPEEWNGWLSVRNDGVYVKSIDKSINLTPQERATLTEHPTRDLSKPALYFPCTLKDLQYFLEKSEAYDCIDPFDMADWAISNRSTSEIQSTNEDPPPKEKTTYLNIIGGMLTLMLGKSPAGKPHSIFNSQSAIIDSLLVHNKGISGISQRTLEGKFAEAKRSLAAT